MTHPLVAQLRFTRSEFRRALVGLTEEEAAQRFMPMNCISWNVGHLAWQEQRYFVYFAQGKMPQPQLNELFAYGAPASIPSLARDVGRPGRRSRGPPMSWLATVTNATLARARRHRRAGHAVYVWLAAAARDLSLLVSHRREPGDPADCWDTRICRSLWATSTGKRRIGRKRFEIFAVFDRAVQTGR